MKLKEFLKNPRGLAIIGAGAIIILILVAIIKPKSSASGTTGREGYMQITAVPGVTFEVDQSLADYATAVLEVSKSVDFVKNASYSYKNGSDTYMLFNMSQFIVIAKKGTTFDFENTKVGDSLELNSLNGIWFSNPSNIDKAENKCTLDVTAQVVITNTIYNDFAGKLSTVTGNGEEWSLFVGTTNAEDAAMQELIKNVTASFGIEVNNQGDAPEIFEIEVDEKVSTPLVSVEVKEVEKPVVVETPVTEDVSDVSDNDSSAEEEPVEETHDEHEEADNEAPIEEAPAEEIDVEEEKVMAASYNQKAPEYKDTKAYTSSLYSMLSVGQIGYFSAAEQSLGLMVEAFVRLDTVNNEKATISLIDKYIKSGDAYYTEMEAPMGTHWESVSFSVKSDVVNDIYVNTSFVGFDGEKIKYRGIEYSSKTYDILNQTKDANGWRTGYVAFYAVPNGCTEYAITFGDSLGEEDYRAFYKVE